MTGPIILNVPQALRHFQQTGFVYTLRGPRSTGPTRAITGSRFRPATLRSLGQVTVSVILLQPTDDQLQDFVRQSGFRTVAEWRAAASPGAGHLYLVERRGT